MSRTINDLRQNMPGTMSGRVDLTQPFQDGTLPGLEYREEGTLTFGDYRETVFRHYRLSFPQIYRATVHFDDGRVFHELDLRTGYWQAEHLCDPDTYRGEFRVDSGDVWFSRWLINGPNKELVLENRFQRLS